MAHSRAAEAKSRRISTVTWVLPLLVASLSCQVDEQGSQVMTPEQAFNSTVGNAAVVLRAARIHGPPVRWEDGEQSFAAPVAFTLPARIPVYIGNGGNHTVELAYRDLTGAQVRCEYRGGSKAPHPGTAYELALAREYRFERCSNWATAGKAVYATWVKLHVRGGDERDPAGRTGVELRLGETFPVLEPPLSAAESIAIRDAFSWQRTQPLPETNSEGLPSLYYALIYVESREHVEALNDLLIHHSPLPFFGNELARWDGQQGMFTHEGDGTGLFVFAIIPAVTYNLLRNAALEGNVIFRVIQLRDIPPKAMGTDGSISYAALRASGFQYLEQEPPPAASAGTAVSSDIRPQFLGSLLRGIIQGIAAVVGGAVREVQRGIGAVDRWGEGAVTLTVRLDVRNTDPYFGGAVAGGMAGASTPMQRGWGARAGQQITLPGVRVAARQRTLGGLLPSLFTKHTGDDGVASLRVTRGRETSICLSAENDAASIVTSFVAVELCDFRVGGGALHEDTTLHLFLQHRYFNVLAQATDGRAYLRELVGFTPRRAIILVGWFANLIKVDGRVGAIAPAFAFPNLAYDGALLALAAAASSNLGPWVAPIIIAAMPIYAVDIILPDNIYTEPGGVGIAAGTFDRVLDSRGVVTHEYGHFALAALLYAQGVENITIAYSDAMISRISWEAGWGDSTESGYLNEAFADFFASQVVGGTNYFDPPQSEQGPGSLSYCKAELPVGAPCIDSNIHEGQGFKQNIERTVSILHDAFDGWPAGTDAPGNGGVWRNSGGTPHLIFSMERRGDSGDEEIRLGASQILRLFQNWDERANLLREQPFMAALADTMRESGFSWYQQCQLFALHDTRFHGGMTPAELAELCSQAPIRDWIGAVPQPPPPPPPPPPPVVRPR